MKNKKISLCGLDCGDCPAYLAFKNNNEALRIKTAKRWGKLFGRKLKPEDINCSGCWSLSTPLFDHCFICGVRKCGLGKKLSNCGECEEYDSCEKISSLHKMIPEGKKACEAVRNKK